MSAYSIRLNDIKEIRHFVDTASKCPCGLRLVSGRYDIDVKSLMGIFTLDLSKPVQLKAECGKGEDFAAFYREIEPYVVS